MKLRFSKEPVESPKVMWRVTGELVFWTWGRTLNHSAIQVAGIGKSPDCPLGTTTVMF